MGHNMTKPSTIKYPLCSVIVVNYNGKNLLERFLLSIIKMDYPNFEVILVDNASKDGSVGLVSSRFPQVRIIENSKNDGTAEGSNVGARQAKGDYVLWLSNDMELNPDFLTCLIELAQSSDDIGICTCKMKRITEKGEKLNEIDSIGGDVDIYGFPSARGINQIDRGQMDQACEVFFSFGGALLIKKSVLNIVDGYDPAYFTLGDDIDLCWRVRLAGYKVMAQPSAILYHRVSATLSKWKRAERRFISERNMFRTILKNYSLRSLATVLPQYLGLLFAEATLLMLRKPEMSMSYVRTVLWNLLNFRATWSRRLAVQATRRVSDEDIKRLMVRRPFKLVILRDFLATRKQGTLKRYLGENP